MLQLTGFPLPSTCVNVPLVTTSPEVTSRGVETTPAHGPDAPVCPRAMTVYLPAARVRAEGNGARLHHLVELSPRHSPCRQSEVRSCPLAHDEQTHAGVVGIRAEVGDARSYGLRQDR